jgi:hypothetical protein
MLHTSLYEHFSWSVILHECRQTNMTSIHTYPHKLCVCACVRERERDCASIVLVHGSSLKSYGFSSVRMCFEVFVKHDAP